MSTKVLRKELEVKLTNTIEDVLVSLNPIVAKKINKSTQEAVKVVAKKFYKTVKLESKIKKATVKKVAKKKVVAASSKVDNNVKRRVKK